MLLGNSHTLTNGLRVRLRLARGGDHRALLDLAARAGSPCGELDAHRWVRVRPRARVALCATAWIDGHERLVGFAAADLDRGEPDVLLADEDAAPGLCDLLAAAVAERHDVHHRVA